MSLLETAMIVEEREREIDVLRYQNDKLSRDCDALEQRNAQLEKIAAIGYRPKPPTTEACTNTPGINFANDLDELDGCYNTNNYSRGDSRDSTSLEADNYKERVIRQKCNELEDVYAEYQLILTENETLRKEHKLPVRDRKKLRRSAFFSGNSGVVLPPSTLRKPTQDASTNTVRSSLPGMAVHKKCTERELEKLRNFLLAEVMSLQLLYSMFDLKTKSQLEREEEEEAVYEGARVKLLDQDPLVSSSTTPSGYETGSDSNAGSVASGGRSHKKNIKNNKIWRSKARTKADTDDTSKINSKKKKTRKQRQHRLSTKIAHDKDIINKNTIRQQKQLIESAVPKTGNSIEEIIEAQRTGSSILSSHGTSSDSPNKTNINNDKMNAANEDLSIETRVQLLKKEICQQKKCMDQELSRVALQQFGIIDQPGEFS